MPNTPNDVHVAVPRAAAGAAAPAPRESDGLVTILLVEDDEDGREMMKEYLESLGVRVDTAATGPEALQRAFARKPTMVLLDMTLPGMSGLEVATRLRADASTRDIPLVALTGREIRAEDREYFERVITKPARLELLDKLVHALFAKRNAARPPS